MMPSSKTSSADHDPVGQFKTMVSHHAFQRIYLCFNLLHDYFDDSFHNKRRSRFTTERNETRYRNI